MYSYCKVTKKLAFVRYIFNSTSQSGRKSGKTCMLNPGKALGDVENPPYPIPVQSMRICLCLYKMKFYRERSQILIKREDKSDKRPCWAAMLGGCSSQIRSSAELWGWITPFNPCLKPPPWWVAKHGDRAQWPRLNQNRHEETNSAVNTRCL
jgi:hypothetical protein